jgi:hypothetical protein
MSFLKRLFGGSTTQNPASQTQKPRELAVTPTPPPPKPVPVKSATMPPSAASLKLPPEFDGKMSYRDMFRNLPPERLRAMCSALPVEQLDLNRPGRPPLAREMGAAITQIFAVSIYMATKEVPSEFGDILFPRLIGKIEEYNGPELHLELCDLVRDFAIHLAAGGRHRDALRVLRVLKSSLAWHTFSQGNLLIYTALHNIAIKTNTRQDCLAAIAAAEQVPASQAEQVRGALEDLKNKMQAL